MTSELVKRASARSKQWLLTVKRLWKNLSVFDKTFQIDQQINTVVESSFFHLRLLAKVKPFLSFNDLERVIHAFIWSQLD